MQCEKKDGIDISRIHVTQITAASYIEPRNIGLFNNRRCFGIFYKLEGSSECRIGRESHVFDKNHIVILPKNSTYQTFPARIRKNSDGRISMQREFLLRSVAGLQLGTLKPGYTQSAFY